MVKCIVVGCKNYIGNKNKKIRFVTFPNKDDPKYSTWFKLCGQSNVLSDEKLVCEAHFPKGIFHTKTCIDKNLSRKLLSCACDFEISNDILPTLNLPTETQLLGNKALGKRKSPPVEEKLETEKSASENPPIGKRIPKRKKIEDLGCEKSAPKIAKQIENPKEDKITPKKRGRPRKNEDENEKSDPKIADQIDNPKEDNSAPNKRNSPRKSKDLENEKSAPKIVKEIENPKEDNSTPKKRGRSRKNDEESPQIIKEPSPEVIELKTPSPGKRKSLRLTEERNEEGEGEEILKHLPDITVQKAAVCDSNKPVTTVGVKRKSAASNKESLLKSKRTKTSTHDIIDDTVNQIVERMTPILPKELENTSEVPELSSKLTENIIRKYQTLVTPKPVFRNLSKESLTQLKPSEVIQKIDLLTENYSSGPSVLKNSHNSESASSGRSVLKNQPSSEISVLQLPEVTISKIKLDVRKVQDLEEGEELEVFSEDEFDVTKHQDYVPQVFELHDLCRVCAQYKKNTVKIFSERGKELQLVDKIDLCLPVEIRQDDELPDIICQECSSSLDASFDLARKCFKADKTLRNMLENDKIMKTMPVFDDSDNQDYDDYYEPLEIFSDHSDDNITSQRKKRKHPPRSQPSDKQQFKSIIYPMRKDNSLIYYCATCTNQKFTSSAAAKQHCFLMHNVYLCESCCAVFATNLELSKHECFKMNENLTTITKITNSNKQQITTSYVCNVCKSEFKTKTDFLNHNPNNCTKFSNNMKKFDVMIVTSLDLKYKFKCVLCAEGLNTITEASKHGIESHQLHMCPICFHMFSESENMQSHLEKGHVLTKSLKDVHLNVNEDSLKSTETSENPKHVCKICWKIFFTSESYDNHLKTSCKDSANDFVEKLKKSTDLSIRQYHNQKVKIGTEMSCQICEKTFKIQGNRSILQNHYKIKHNAYLCRICMNYYNFNTKQMKKHVIKNHQKIKDSEKYSCNYCQKLYVFKTNLRTHIKKLHLKIKNVYKCKKCRKNFKNRKSFTTHMQMHEMSTKNPREMLKISNCKLCISKVPTKYLKSHYKKVHNNFLCKYCINAHFETKKLLENHLRNRHKKIKNNTYICEICKNEFNTKNQLKSHIMSIHLKLSKKYGCGPCKIHYNLKSELLNHLKSFHQCKTIENCKICKYFTLENNLETHMNTVHEFHCNICYIDLKNITALGYHYRLYHATDWTYICNICKAEFDLESTVILHCDYHNDEEKCRVKNKLYSKVTPFHCSDCNVYYVSYLLLKFHMDSVHKDKVKIIEGNFESVLEEMMVTSNNDSKPVLLEECVYCDMKFVNREELKEHFTSIHFINE